MAPLHLYCVPSVVYTSQCESRYKSINSFVMYPRLGEIAMPQAVCPAIGFQHAFGPFACETAILDTEPARGVFPAANLGQWTGSALSGHSRPSKCRRVAH
jgi:hypothetical protein